MPRNPKRAATVQAWPFPIAILPARMRLDGPEIKGVRLARHNLSLLMILLILGVSGCREQPTPSNQVRTLEVLSEPMEVSQLYTSMLGPMEEKRLTLGEDGARELFWVVGYEAKLLSENSQEEVPERFMCHVSIDLDKDLYQERLAPRLDAAYRLVTLSQGVTKVDFPEGFGMPIPSDQLLWLRTQILNLNSEKLEDRVRFDIKLHYIRDADLKAPLKSLFLVRAPVVKAVDPDGNHFGGVPSEAACSVGVNANPEGYLERDSQGQAFMPHWKVLPGREETKTLITERLSLPEDMRIHAIVSHVHPTAESLTLVDLTTMEQVYQCQIESSKERLEMTSVDVYSSPEGLLLEKEHQYGLISVYDNYTDRELDSMAVMYLYLHDPSYLPPTSAELSTPLPPSSEVVSRTENEVKWKSETLYPLAYAFYRSYEDWTAIQTASDWSEWNGPTGRLRVEQSGSSCQITLTLP